MLKMLNLVINIFTGFSHAWKNVCDWLLTRAYKMS